MKRLSLAFVFGTIAFVIAWRLFDFLRGIAVDNVSSDETTLSSINSTPHSKNPESE